MNRKFAQEIIQQRHWDRVAGKQWRGGYTFQERVEIEDFISFMNLCPGSSILEIGAGTGRWTIALLERGHRVTATDLSIKSLRWLKELAEANGIAGNLQVLNTNFEEVCLRRHFDCVLFGGVIHHIDGKKKDRIIGNTISTLKPGGRVVAFEPNPLNLLYYCAYLYRFAVHPADKNQWSTEKGMLSTSALSLRRLFRSQGLANISVKHHAWFPSSFYRWFGGTLRLNKTLNGFPLIRELSAFIWIQGTTS